MENESIISIPVDAEKAALDTIAKDVGVNSTSIAADRVAMQKNLLEQAGNGARVLTLKEYKEAAYSLALAFKDDHSSMYFTHTPDRADWSEEQKWELHLKIMEYITYAHLLKGLVVSAGPNYDCVALWWVYSTDDDVARR